jgi:hypothetical protein
MTEYKKLQIIKHALTYYLTMPDMSEKDASTVKRLLDSTVERVEFLKEKYHITDRIK